MLHHPQHALRTPRRRSPRSKASRPTRVSFSIQERLFISPPGFLLRNSEPCVHSCQEGGGEAGRSAEFRLGWRGLSFGGRHLVRAQAIVRFVPLSLLVSFARSERVVVGDLQSTPIFSESLIHIHPHRCPQLKSIGVGFGALLPGIRSHVGLYISPPRRPTQSEPPSPDIHSYSTSRTSKASPYGSSPPFTLTSILM